MLIDYLGSRFLNRGPRDGSVEILEGEFGTRYEDYMYSYPYGEYPDRYIDEMEPVDGGEVFFRSQDGVVRVIGYTVEIEGVQYRTVTSSVIFGYLHYGTHSKEELMMEYLDFLLGNYIETDKE